MKTRMAVCLVALLGTTACESQRVPMELVGAAAGAALGGYVGAQFGGGMGQWAYIAGGTLIGGAGGFEVGRILNESDLVFYRDTAQKALSNPAGGTTMAWSNPTTGNSGVVRPSSAFQAHNGQTCRQFRSTVAFSDAVESGVGTACHQSDGSWKIVSNYFG